MDSVITKKKGGYGHENLINKHALNCNAPDKIHLDVHIEKNKDNETFKYSPA